MITRVRGARARVNTCERAHESIGLETPMLVAACQREVVATGKLVAAHDDLVVAWLLS